MSEHGTASFRRLLMIDETKSIHGIGMLATKCSLESKQNTPVFTSKIENE